MQEAADLPDYSKITFPPLTPIPLTRLLPNASLLAIDLLEHLLVFNPHHRLSAQEVMYDIYIYMYSYAALQPSYPTYYYH